MRTGTHHYRPLAINFIPSALHPERTSLRPQPRYVQRYFNANVNDTEHYHLVINCARTGFVGAAQVVTISPATKKRNEQLLWKSPQSL